MLQFDFWAPGFYALERMALTHTRPARHAFAHAYLGGDWETVQAHAAYNELCFVEHVLGAREETQWNDWVRAWCTP